VKRYGVLALLLLGSCAGRSWLLFATALVAVPLVLVGSGWLRPFPDCHFCGGKGYRKRWFSKRLRPCRRCNGIGRRLRRGRRIYNWAKKRQRMAGVKR